MLFVLKFIFINLPIVKLIIPGALIIVIKGTQHIAIIFESVALILTVKARIPEGLRKPERYVP